MSINQKSCVGGIYFSRIAYVREKNGQNALDRLLNEMVAKGYDGPMSEKEIKIAKMYPMDYNILFLKTYKELYGENNFRKLGKESAKKKGFLGMFLKWAGNPEMVVKKAGDYWKKMYNFGKIDGHILDSNKARIVGEEISPDPVFCEFLTSYFMGVLETTGVKNIISIHTKCVHRGDDRCEWDLTWGDVSKEDKDIRWSSSLETGIDEIDRQHRYFVRILNDLNKAVTKNHRTTITKTLIFMDRYAHWHFSSEEKYMKKYDYFGYDSHRREHQQFYEYTDNIRKKVREGEVDEGLALAVNKYLIDWLVNHIKGTDAIFAEFLRKNGLKMEEEKAPEDMAGLMKEM